jgi:hypothetical protein
MLCYCSNPSSLIYLKKNIRRESLVSMALRAKYRPISAFVCLFAARVMETNYRYLNAPTILHIVTR